MTHIRLVSYDPHVISCLRRRMRRSSHGVRLTMRNGQAYSMVYHPACQPRTEQQQKNWSLFTEANRLVTVQFHSRNGRRYWLRRLRQQNVYKTARGLARAHFLSLLRSRMASTRQNIATSTPAAARTLRLCPVSIVSSAVSANNTSWHHYRNITWWNSQLHLSQKSSPDSRNFTNPPPQRLAVAT